MRDHVRVLPAILVLLTGGADRKKRIYAKQMQQVTAVALYYTRCYPSERLLWNMNLAAVLLPARLCSLTSDPALRNQLSVLQWQTGKVKWVASAALGGQSVYHLRLGRWGKCMYGVQFRAVFYVVITLGSEFWWQVFQSSFVAIWRIPGRLY